MKALGTLILALASRDGAAAGASWIHLLPAGQFSGRDGRGPYHLSDADAVMMASRQHAGRQMIPIDYDHQIDHAAANGRPAPAAGWIKGLQSRPDGIWGLADWTPAATDHLAKHEYRYLSPVFNHTPDGRVTRILRAALTNNPNLDQLTALAAMEDIVDPTAVDGFAELRKLLGLPIDADAMAVIGKVRELLTASQSAIPDPSRFVPIGDFERVTTELNRVNKGVSLQAAKAVVDQEIGAGRLPPFLKDWGVALCGINKPAFDAFIARTGPSVHRLFEPSVATGLFRMPGEKGDLSDDEAIVSRALGHSPEEFRKGGRS